jgi:uncharacterized membrane protein
LLDKHIQKSCIADLAKGRLLPLDALRGLIMILMAMDHASYFVAKVHRGEFWGISLPQYCDVLPFLTRWVTHVCAPGFFLLMGVGMILFRASRLKAGWIEKKIIRFFVTRGLLLIVLQLLVENPAWMLGGLGAGVKQIEPPGGGEAVMLHFGVLYGLGASMILFAILLRANAVTIASLSIGSIFATQWLTPGVSEVGVLHSPLLRLILIPGHTGIWQSFYPIVPWLGISGIGIVFGKLLLKDSDKLLRYAFPVGLTSLGFFFAIRWLDGFGNFHSWSNGWISFLNVTKYPPSLSFVLLTLGISFLFIFLFSRTEQVLTRIGQPLLIFGRTALFFYVVHLYLYAIIGLAFPNGTSWQRMYLFWFLGLLMLFPMCLWYGKFKKKKPMESVWRFF